MPFQGKCPNTQLIEDLLAKHKIVALKQVEIPTVGELRGKVWLMSGYGVTFNNTFVLLGEYGVVVH